jgi:hypothetical protein
VTTQHLAPSLANHGCHAAHSSPERNQCQFWKSIVAA